MESRESRARILEILFDMFRNHSPSRIISTCEQKQWKLENCIETLLENDLASSQGAVPKAGTRNNVPSYAEISSIARGISGPEEVTCQSAGKQNIEISNFQNSNSEQRTSGPHGATSRAADKQNNEATSYFENSSNEQRILNQLRAGRRVMVIMRGAPGSGKSFLARLLVKKSMPDIKYHEMKNFIFSTDDYFTNRRGNYNRQVGKLSEAHNDNQRKVEAKAIAGCSLIIVDNTNLQVWEMMPYIQIAVKNDYRVELLEPQTPWRHSVEHLTEKNAHGVPFDKIKRMLDKYEPATAEQLVQMVKYGKNPQQNRPNLSFLDSKSPTDKIKNLKPLNSEHSASKISLGFDPLPQRVQRKNKQNMSIQNAGGGLNTAFDVQPVPFRDIADEAEANKNILECYNNKPYQHNNERLIHSTIDLKDIPATKPSDLTSKTNKHRNQIETEKDEFVELQLNSNVVYQLKSVLGSEGDSGMDFLGQANEFLTVFVPRALANELYRLCCQARLEYNQKQKQEADENFAKLIQNTKYCEISEAPENLQELLDYEMALRLLSLEKNEPQRSSQENLATYLRKLKIAEDFANTPSQSEKPSDATRAQRNAAYDKEHKCLALSDFEEYRNLAVHHCQLKAECYQKAKEMVQKGNNAVAGYYSQIAHFHKKKIDMYNERAANCIIEVHMLTGDNPDLLDLHHLHVAEAIECLDLFLDRHISNTRGGTRAYKNVFIITGRGLHSTGGISAIKNKVRTRLKERNLKWSEVNPGLLKVKVFSSSRFSK